MTVRIPLARRAAAAGAFLACLLLAPAGARADDSFEPNDEPERAVRLTSGRYLGLTCANEDWFRLELLRPGAIAASAEHLHAEGALRLELYDAEGTLLQAAQAPADGARVEATALGAGSYFLHVYGNAGQANRYDLIARFEGEIPPEPEPAVAAAPPPPPSGDDAYEENDSNLQATLLAPGTYPGLIAADEDWYRLEAPAGQTLTARVAFATASGDIDIQLFHETRGEVANSMGYGDEESVSCAGPGPFFLVVFCQGGARSGYTLTVTVGGGGGSAEPAPSAQPPAPPAPVEDIYEPNQSFTRARTLAPGRYPALLCADDDWFRFDVAPERSLTIALRHEDAGVQFELYGPGLERLQDATGGSMGAQVTVSPPGGTYYLRVYGTRPEPARYSLEVTNPSPPPAPAADEDRYEENDTFARARPLEPGLHADLRCHDEDWFRIELARPAALDVLLQLAEAHDHLDVVLFDAELRELGAARGGSASERIRTESLAPGRYWVQVHVHARRRAIGVTGAVLDRNFVPGVYALEIGVR